MLFKINISLLFTQSYLVFSYIYLYIYRQTGWTFLCTAFCVISCVDVSALFVCSSGIDNNGLRQTEVVNKQEEFLPPTLLLSVYLEQLS